MSKTFDMEKESPYEELRTVYDKEIHTSSVHLKEHYINSMKTQLSRSIYQSIDDDELVRLGFHLEDLVPEDRKDVAAIDFAEWLDYNYRRNPKFFSKYFTIRDESEIPIESEEDIDEDSGEQFQGEPSESFMKMIENPNQFQRKQLPKAFEIDSVITDTVTHINNARKAEMQRVLVETISRLAHVDYVTKDDVMANLAETNTYRQVITEMFALLQVSLSTTQVNSETKQVSNQKMAFAPSTVYSLDDVKKGFAEAKLKIESLINKESQYDNKVREISTIKSDLVTRVNEKAKAESSLKEMEKKFATESKKPKIEDAVPLYYYVAYEDDEKIWYIGTTAEEANSKGVYPVNTLIKTAKRNAAIRFTDKDLALNQIDRMKKYYSKINRAQKISLPNVNSAFTILIAEYSDKSNLTKVKQVEM